MPARKDWKSLLLAQSKKDKAKILTNLDEIKMGEKTRINFKCHCGIDHNKASRKLVYNTGFFCKNCSKINANNRRKKTNTKKYGVEYNLQSKICKEKSKKTCLKKYGKEYANQSDIVKEKITQINLKKYGYKCSLQNNIIKNKAKKTIIKKYGVDNVAKSKIIRDKIEKTNIERYGCKAPAQNKKVFSKMLENSFKKKKYNFNTGEIVYIQGDEPHALDLLQQQGYTYNDLSVETDRIPIIKYIFNGKKCKYYPDIYIPCENRIIEVKSTWTYKKKIEKNLEKQKATINSGYNFEFWIYNDKKEVVIK